LERKPQPPAVYVSFGIIPQHGGFCLIFSGQVDPRLFPRAVLSSHVIRSAGRRRCRAQGRAAAGADGQKQRRPIAGQITLARAEGDQQTLSEASRQRARLKPFQIIRFVSARAPTIRCPRMQGRRPTREIRKRPTQDACKTVRETIQKIPRNAVKSSLKSLQIFRSPQAADLFSRVIFWRDFFSVARP
jgi:hypothetical protein